MGHMIRWFVPEKLRRRVPGGFRSRTDPVGAMSCVFFVFQLSIGSSRFLRLFFSGA